MATITETPTRGIIRFGIPDLSVPAEERGLYSPPGYSTINDSTVELHDARTDASILQGVDGLDTQGFAWVNHHSALTEGRQWFADDNIEKVYIPDCEELIQKLTGCRHTCANHVYMRRKGVALQNDPKFVLRKGDALDKLLASMPSDRNLIFGREDADKSLEPARMAHVDYTTKGLKATARFARGEISDKAKEALEAEDAGQTAPRYAAYSLWRPLSTVKRDPLAVCDVRTMDKKLLQPSEYRARSDLNESKDYMNELYMVTPGQDKEIARQKWCWMSNQTPDEALVIKFADTADDVHCAHGSPNIPGTENEAVRESIEVRVLAFW